MLTPGLLIDERYRVERAIGEGGMGAVYAARDERSGGSVALKVLLDTDDPTLRKRFLREAKIAATLTSEHVPRIFGTGELEDGTPYMLMELLEGEDLWDVVHRRGPLAPEQAVDYVLQAGEALREAHALGMVHRDVKPSNLFLATRADGTRIVKLLDFGISKPALSTTAPVTQLTQTGSVLGSPEYMSPEQLVSSSDVDGRSDIWSLGATLHELLTGHPAFAGNTLAEVVSAIMRDPPSSLREVRPDTPSDLEAVLRRCLEKDPELRYQSIDEMAQWLRRAVPTPLESAPTLHGAAAAPTHHDHPTAHAPTLADGSFVAAPHLPPTLAAGPQPAPPAAAAGRRSPRWPLVLFGGAGVLVTGIVIGTLASSSDERESEASPPKVRTTRAPSPPPAPVDTRADAKLDEKKLIKKLHDARARIREQPEAAEALAVEVLEAVEAAGLRRLIDVSDIAAQAEVVRARVDWERARRAVEDPDGPVNVSFRAGEAMVHGISGEHWNPQSTSCPAVIFMEGVFDVVRAMRARPRTVTNEKWIEGWTQRALAIPELLNTRPTPPVCKAKAESFAISLRDLRGGPGDDKDGF